MTSATPTDDANGTNGTNGTSTAAKSLPVTERVAKLRALMRTHGVDAYIVPSEDAHLSEYVAACDERRAYISGFTGSAGTVLVTADHAYLWTDGRYFTQAAMQLDSSVYTLMRMYEDPAMDLYITSHLSHLRSIGVDATTNSVAAVKKLRSALAGTPATLVTDLSTNLVDEVWATDGQPKPPANPVRVHALQYAGVDVQTKLTNVRARMATDQGAALFVVTALDEIAWLLNMRGSDIDYNPVFLAYVLVTATGATLCCNEARFDPGVSDHLAAAGVTVRPYTAVHDEIASAIDTLSGKKAKISADDSNETATTAPVRVWLDGGSCNYAILAAIERHCSAAGVPHAVCDKQSPIALLKARKNETEIAGMRACHERDAVALCKYLAWLEDEVANKGKSITEWDGSVKLDELRGQLDLFISPSFPSISGSGSNGAVIHYKPERDTAKPIRSDALYLIDSGGQFHDGTTDVTRTVHLSREPTAWERETFTRVLKGHIALDAAVFPKGTTGHLLDAFARSSLWAIGKDYKHGTGHGVGCCLNVHEGPHMISFKHRAIETPFEVGFLTSNEPGYYEEGGFGIRIENVCVVTKEEKASGKDSLFMTLDHFTVVPIQRELIDEALLGRNEVDWLNSYHEKVWAKVSPQLADDTLTLEWLKRNTQKIEMAC